MYLDPEPQHTPAENAVSNGPNNCASLLSESDRQEINDAIANGKKTKYDARSTLSFSIHRDCYRRFNYEKR